MENQQFQPQQQGLPGVWNLLLSVLDIYKRKIKILAGIIIIPAAVSLSPTVIYFTSALFLSGFGVIGAIIFSFAEGIISAFIFSWSSLALIFAIIEKEKPIGIKESYKKTWHKLLSFWWVSALLAFILTTGYLLIIPGIIFSFWFIFTSYIFVVEDLKGTSALFKSKQLVKGYWWKIFWRFLVVGVVGFIFIFIASFVLDFLMEKVIKFYGININYETPGIITYDIIRNIIQMIIGYFVLTPISLIFSFLIYENLKRIKSGMQLEPQKPKEKIFYILVAIVGGLFLVYTVLSPFISSFYLTNDYTNNLGSSLLSEINEIARLDLSQKRFFAQIKILTGNIYFDYSLYSLYREMISLVNELKIIIEAWLA